MSLQFWTSGAGFARLRAMPASMADCYDMLVTDARAAEALGFDGYAAPEHHFMYDGFMPAPLQALAAIAAATSRIRLGTGAMLLPLYDPLRAAEDAATVDVLSGGRLFLGLGMGYRPLEFDGLGFDKRTRGERLVEAIRFIEQASASDEITFEGKHYRYDRVRLHPAPVQRPIPVWFCGGTSARAAVRAGAAGLPYWLANCSFDQAELVVKEYRRAGSDAGWPEDRLRVAAFKDVCIGDSVAEAEDLRRMWIDGFYEEHILGYGYLVDDNGRHVYNPPADHPIRRRFLDAFFCGTVDMAVEELKRYETLGVEAVLIATTQREIFASKIIPEFRS